MTTRPTRRRTARGGRIVRLATLMVVAALALTGCDFSVYSLPLPGGADLGDNPYQVTIEFRDVMDLVPQTSVKVDDVTVGKVDQIKVDGYHAEVTVLLRDSVKLPDNADGQDPPDQPARREVRVPGAADQRRRAAAGSATATPSRSSGPAATRRSRRSSARCPCCSTVAAWRSSRPSRPS